MSDANTTPEKPQPLEQAKREDLFNFVNGIHRVHGFRSSLMWGIASGAVMAAHSFFNHRNINKASSAGVLTFLTVSGGFWLYSRNEYRRIKESHAFFLSNQSFLAEIESADPLKREEMREAFKRQLKQHQEATKQRQQAVFQDNHQDQAKDQ